MARKVVRAGAKKPIVAECEPLDVLDLLTEQSGRILAVRKSRRSSLGDAVAGELERGLREAAVEVVRRDSMGRHGSSRVEGSDGVPLAEAIFEIKRQIQEAQKRLAQSPSLAFTVGDIEMEFEVCFERGSKKEVEMKLALLPLGVRGGGTANTQRHAIQRMKITLHPHDPRGPVKGTLVGSGSKKDPRG